LFLDLWVLHNCVITLDYYIIYGEWWLQLVELCCLSEPGNVEFVLDIPNTYGTIARVWIGPHLAVVLAEAKYVEVSKVALAL
jgi:hypothetical protein